MIKAWAIYNHDFEVVSIYAAETRGKAIARALTEAREAGYETVRWADFRCKRAACFDGLIEQKPDRIHRYPIGYHARSYDLSGNFTGFSNFGCFDGQRQSPDFLYASIGKEKAA